MLFIEYAIKSFIEYGIFGSCLSCRGLFNGSWILISIPIQTRSVLELQICSNHLNIGQDSLNVALTMYKLSLNIGK